uniref:Coiled-coil domain-containing protein 47 n=1 Tax=Palpitomonas bilix TaxID=652834 RepID=A0A7S3DH34_9EUKA|mmetsp:Transcript_36735/g.95101  ORF Transcript_36735/g.95101 Transcript_36735/m.95101 type:complete len:483 (+) Transcript_36735:39-1487(+)
MKRKTFCLVLLSFLFLTTLVPSRSFNDDEFDEDEDEFEVAVDGMGVEKEAARATGIFDELEDEEEDLVHADDNSGFGGVGDEGNEMDDEEEVVMSDDSEEEEEIVAEEELDEDEFEHVEVVRRGKRKMAPRDPSSASSSPSDKDEIKIEEISNDYTMEYGFIAFIIVFVVNYLYGRFVNYGIAGEFESAAVEALSSQFSLVGNTREQMEKKDFIMNETVNLHRIYASGRRFVSSSMVTIDLQPRHDLLQILYSLVNPREDKLVVDIVLEPKTFSNTMITVVAKKYEQQHASEFKDFERNVSRQKKNVGALRVWAEAGEVIPTFLPQKFESFVKENEKHILCLHISDIAVKVDPQAVDAKEPEPTPFARFVYRLPSASSKRKEAIDEFLHFSYAMVDKWAAAKLTEKALKAIQKNRQSIDAEARKRKKAELDEEAKNKKIEAKREEEKKVLAMGREEQIKYEEKEKKKENKNKLKQRVKVMKM